MIYSEQVQPAKWTFLDYVDGASDPIEDWYQNLSDEAQELFHSVLKNISKTEIPTQWVVWKGFLEGKLKEEKIFELYFRADRRQYRILGKFGDKRKQVILLIGCYHKEGNYTPTDALETAYKRAKSLKQGGGGLRERKIRTDL